MAINFAWAWDMPVPAPLPPEETMKRYMTRTIIAHDGHPFPQWLRLLLNGGALPVGYWGGMMGPLP